MSGWYDLHAAVDDASTAKFDSVKPSIFGIKTH